MTTNVDVTNQALAEIGTKSQITSMTDGSEEARYANLVYNPLRDFMLREGDYDFSLATLNAVLAAFTPNPAAFAYEYPVTAVRIRSLVPVNPDPLNPIPVEYNVITSGTAKVIVSRLEVSVVVFTYTPPEDTWDSMFREAFVRMLGSVLAFALENRIEASKEKLTEALNFAGIANLRDS